MPSRIRRLKDIIAEKLLGVSQSRSRPRALATWRGWLMARDERAVKTFLGPGTEVSRLSIDSEPASVKYNLDLGDISPEDWEKFVDLGLSMMQNSLDVAESQAIGTAMTVALMRAPGHCRDDLLPFGTWLALWRVNPVIALGSIGSRGYEIILATNNAFDASQKWKSRENYGEKELARVGTEGVIVWSRNSRGLPVAKRVGVEAASDVKPLLMASDKATRMLGAKLLGEVKKTPEITKRGR